MADSVWMYIYKNPKFLDFKIVSKICNDPFCRPLEDEMNLTFRDRDGLGYIVADVYIDKSINLSADRIVEILFKIYEKYFSSEVAFVHSDIPLEFEMATHVIFIEGEQIYPVCDLDYYPHGWLALDDAFSRYNENFEFDFS